AIRHSSRLISNIASHRSTRSENNCWMFVVTSEREQPLPQQTQRGAITMKRIKARVLSIWKSWMNSPKTEGTVANDACPCCGAHVYAPRTTAKDTAITI